MNKVKSKETAASSDGGQNEAGLFYDKACVVCGGAVPGERIGEVSEHEYTNTTTANFPVYRCPECHLVYLYPRPDRSELSTIYPSNYYSYHLTEQAGSGDEAMSFVQKLFYNLNLKNYKKRIKPYLKARPTGRPLRVLDIGCGVGTQLDLMKNILGDCETYGIELDDKAVEKARKRGHKVYHDRFEELELEEAYFDVIISIHVIEHVERPDLFIKKCSDVIAKDGIIMLETPNTDSVDFALFKKGHWGGYHAPRHWYLFERRTLERLAQESDFEVVDSGACTTSVNWNWTCHSILMRYVGRTVADAIFPPIKIFYGGIRSLVILGFFALLERLLLLLTGRGNSIWIVLEKRSRP